MVVSAAIDKYVSIYVNRPAADQFIRLKYTRYEEVERVEQIQHDLVRPALAELDLGPSLEVVSMADVPAGTGLGSSSTYLVALLSALYELKKEKVPHQTLAEMACHIEMDLAQHPSANKINISPLLAV
jgi:D-glycero-alpha-D-manno-heptose-7-phosphate kinase